MRCCVYTFSSSLLCVQTAWDALSLLSLSLSVSNTRNHLLVSAWHLKLTSTCLFSQAPPRYTNDFVSAANTRLGTSLYLFLSHAQPATTHMT